MRRCISLGLRSILASTNLKRFLTLKVYHEQFSTYFVAPVTCNFAEIHVSKCEEQRVFDGLDVPHSSSSLQVLEHNNQIHILPGPPPYTRLLKECAELGKLREGQIVHAHVLKSEFKDLFGIQNSIINMYAKCGGLAEARRFFDEMPSKDMVTWTTMIISYSQNNKPEEALVMFPHMLRVGLKPNKFTFSSLLKVSGAVSGGKYGMVIHAICVKYGCDSDVYVGTSLVDMYARCGLMNEALSIFEGLLSKNEACWNALISGHARIDEGEKALTLFQRMKREDFEPDQFTYSSMLSACANTGALEQGKWIHAHVVKSGVKLIAFVGHTLLHMYAKSGSIEDAEKVFSRLMKQNVVTWNSMLTGYAQHGLGDKTLDQFEKMLKTGIQPNVITFLCVLTACSHAGLLEKGQFYLDMIKTYGLEPHIEHYVTVVDLLGRAGKLDQALRFIRDRTCPLSPPQRYGKLCWERAGCIKI